MSIQRKLSLSKDVKVWTLDLEKKAPGFAVGPDFASFTADKSFVSCYKDYVTLGGDKVSMQISPGQQKWMGGLFKTMMFPMTLFPFMPQHTFDPEIILSIINLGKPIIEGFALTLMG
tara:strand:+ start:4918 stop:5268 length:351 start_codon:yes stop_codon:yes gene_type:complete